MRRRIVHAPIGLDLGDPSGHAVTVKQAAQQTASMIGDLHAPRLAQTRPELGELLGDPDWGGPAASAS